MICQIENEVFARFPEACRSIVVGKGIDNFRSHPELTALLEERIEAIRDVADDPRLDRLQAWDQAYRSFGANPQEHAPSIAYLVQQIQCGNPPRSTSPVVDLLRYVSLKYLLPAEGDDLGTIEEDLTLGLATGNEVFAPLTNPAAKERPAPGEIIYVNRRSQRVLCRRWSWQRAHFSRIRTNTCNAVIHIDGLSSFVGRDEMEDAAEELMHLLLRFCSGMVSRWFLYEGHSRVEI